jgi:hypothetical protein
MVHRLLLTYLFYVKIYLVFTKSREKIEDSKAFIWIIDLIFLWKQRELEFIWRVKIELNMHLDMKKYPYQICNLFFSFLFFKQGYMKLILIMKKWWCLFGVWLQLFFKVFFVAKCIKMMFFLFFFKSMHQNNSKYIKKFKFF